MIALPVKKGFQFKIIVTSILILFKTFSNTVYSENGDFQSWSEADGLRFLGHYVTLVFLVFNITLALDARGLDINSSGIDLN